MGTSNNGRPIQAFDKVMDDKVINTMISLDFMMTAVQCNKGGDMHKGSY